MEYDVVIVGAGPAGLAAACRLKQLAGQTGTAISVCLIEKGAAIGSHSLSGAILEPRALEELFPDWRTQGTPAGVPVCEEAFYLLRSASKAIRWPQMLLPASMHNHGNYIISLGELCRWLGAQAEALGVEIYPGFAAQDLILEQDRVCGVITGDHGIGRDGKPRDGAYTPGIELRARYTLFGEGCRGHLGRRLLANFRLDEAVDPQHYAIGMKEIWEIEAGRHTPGLVVHGAGWPLAGDSHGGFFLYHAANHQVSVGLIVDLSYRNPYLSPFQEFQRLKQHPLLRGYLDGGRRISYGARTISKGGLNSLPKMVFPGGALIGCELGTLNFAKVKGIHTAMKSGMLAAEAIVEQLGANPQAANTLNSLSDKFRSSWLYDELYRSRNFGAAIHKFGTLAGGAFNLLDQSVLGGQLPLTLHDPQPDHACLLKVVEAPKITYPKPDGKLSFDLPSSVYLANTVHAEDQPVHLTLLDPDVPILINLPLYDEPAQRYCPAGVYEIIEKAPGVPHLQINAQNCVHCKACDIKDPTQNIVWIAPAGGSGPNYPDM
jgi:electron-transferring-flavoprotein dehydrogenase